VKVSTVKHTLFYKNNFNSEAEIWKKI